MSDMNPNNEPTLLTELPLCIKKTIDSINEVIVSDKLELDEKHIIKMIRFRNYLANIDNAE